MGRGRRKNLHLCCLGSSSIPARVLKSELDPVGHLLTPRHLPLLPAPMLLPVQCRCPDIGVSHPAAPPPTGPVWPRLPSPAPPPHGWPCRICDGPPLHRPRHLTASPVSSASSRKLSYAGSDASRRPCCLCVSAAPSLHQALQQAWYLGHT
jgi:hypothetical protein